MTRLLAAFCMLLASMLAASNESMASTLEGTWGLQRDDGQPVCAGTAVMVLRQGRYFSVLPRVGTSVGERNIVIDHSVYRIDGDRLYIELGRSLRRFTPAQRFLIDPMGGLQLRNLDDTTLVYRRCEINIVPDETW